MFGRKSPADPTPEAVPSTEPTSGKGRPTPSRKEAEAARKQSLKVPKDPKEARRAARERDRADRAASRAALMTGDERAMPARDRGPVRGYTRDFIDGRFTIAEYFIFIALGVLVLGFIPNSFIQFGVSIAWMLLILVVGFDSTYLAIRLNSALKAQWPDKAERKGAILYGLLRSLQLRRFRLPPPRVTRKGAPKAPKS